MSAIVSRVVVNPYVSFLMGGPSKWALSDSKLQSACSNHIWSISTSQV